VNWGNVRDQDLHDKVIGELKELWIYDGHSRDSMYSPGSKWNDPTKWTHFDTQALVDDSHAATRPAWLRITNGQALNVEIYELLLELVALTLKAFVSQDEGYNCENVSGTVYCNVPDAVRVSSHTSTIRLQVLTSVLPD
jgi:hypothetical protein